MRDPATLATVASIIAGFGSARLAFRLERELTAEDEGGWHADIPTSRALYPPSQTFEMWLKQGGAASIEKLLNRPG